MSIQSETRPTRAESAGLTGVRQGFDLTYIVLSVLFGVAVVVQFYLAGYGAFAHHHGAHVVHHAFSAHEELGNILGIWSVVLLVLALVARVSRRVVVAAFVVALLTEPVQHALVQFGKDHRWVGGLHAFNGTLILVLAIWVAWMSWNRRSGSRARRSA